MADLTTHVLDVSNGCPAAGVSVSLYRITRQGSTLLAETVTNADGRTDRPMLEAGDTVPGTYELQFDIGAYFSKKGQGGDEIPFLNMVPVRFAISDTTRHYHVPLLVAPWSYTTYRGS